MLHEARVGGCRSIDELRRRRVHLVVHLDSRRAVLTRRLADGGVTWNSFKETKRFLREGGRGGIKLVVCLACFSTAGVNPFGAILIVWQLLA